MISNNAIRHDRDHLVHSAVAAKEAVADLAVKSGRYARHSADHAVKLAKAKAGAYNDKVVGFIRTNPYTSLSIAAGAGLMVGWLLRRR